MSERTPKHSAHAKRKSDANTTRSLTTKSRIKKSTPKLDASQPSILSFTSRDMGDSDNDDRDSRNKSLKQKEEEINISQKEDDIEETTIPFSSEKNSRELRAKANSNEIKDKKKSISNDKSISGSLDDTAVISPDIIHPIGVRLKSHSNRRSLGLSAKPRKSSEDLESAHKQFIFDLRKAYGIDSPDSDIENETKNDSPPSHSIDMADSEEDSPLLRRRNSSLLIRERGNAANELSSKDQSPSNTNAASLPISSQNSPRLSSPISKARSGPKQTKNTDRNLVTDDFFSLAPKRTPNITGSYKRKFISLSTGHKKRFKSESDDDNAKSLTKDPSSRRQTFAGGEQLLLRNQSDADSDLEIQHTSSSPGVASPQVSPFFQQRGKVLERDVSSIRSAETSSQVVYQKSSPGSELRTALVISDEEDAPEDSKNIKIQRKARESSTEEEQVQRRRRVRRKLIWEDDDDDKNEEMAKDDNRKDEEVHQKVNDDKDEKEKSTKIIVDEINHGAPKHRKVDGFEVNSLDADGKDSEENDFEIDLSTFGNEVIETQSSVSSLSELPPVAKIPSVEMANMEPSNHENTEFGEKNDKNDDGNIRPKDVSATYKDSMKKSLSTPSENVRGPTLGARASPRNPFQASPALTLTKSRRDQVDDVTETFYVDIVSTYGRKLTNQKRKPDLDKVEHKARDGNEINLDEELKALTSSSSARKTKNKKEINSCPVCSKHFSNFELDQHVSNCNGLEAEDQAVVIDTHDKPSDKSRPGRAQKLLPASSPESGSQSDRIEDFCNDENQKKKNQHGTRVKKAIITNNVSPPKSNKSSSVNMGECPFCQKSMPISRLQAHVDKEHSESDSAESNHDSPLHGRTLDGDIDRRNLIHTISDDEEDRTEHNQEEKQDQLDHEDDIIIDDDDDDDDYISTSTNLNSHRRQQPNKRGSSLSAPKQRSGRRLTGNVYGSSKRTIGPARRSTLPDFDQPDWETKDYPVTPAPKGRAKTSTSKWTKVFKNGKMNFIYNKNFKESGGANDQKTKSVCKNRRITKNRSKSVEKQPEANYYAETHDPDLPDPGFGWQGLGCIDIGY